MKAVNQQQTHIEKTKRKKNRSYSAPKSYRDYFGFRSNEPGIFYGSIKNTASQRKKALIQMKRQSSDGDSSIKNDASSSRSRQLKSAKQNKNAFRKAEAQKFTTLISSLNELLSKTLLPIDLYQQLTQQLNEINQNGLEMIKSKTNENDNQDDNSDNFEDSWNNFISTFQKFLSEPTKSQLIIFFSSHINLIQNIMNTIADYPPTNLNFIPQWSSILLQFNADIKKISDSISNFKKQNINDIKSSMADFSDLLKNFQLKLNDTKLFKLSSLTMSKREESQFNASKSTVKMIKYSDQFAKDQFSSGTENSLILATEKINNLMPQFHQIFASQQNENKPQKSLKKLNRNNKSTSNNRTRTASPKNTQSNDVSSVNKKTNENNTAKSDNKDAKNSIKQNKNNKIRNIKNDDGENSNEDDNEDVNENIVEEDYNEDDNTNSEDDDNNNENDNENHNQTNDNEEEELNPENQENDDENIEDENDENGPAVNFQIKSAKKYNKIFKKKLEETLQEEKKLNDEINEKTAALESSRKLLRNLKLTRNQIDAVQRRNDAIKTKAALEKQLDSLRSEISRLEERIRSKKDEHEQFLLVKKDLENAQIENEYVKTVKKINSKYLRRLNSNPNSKQTSNTGSNTTVCISETASSLLAPASISTTTQTTQSSSIFDQSIIDAVKKLQEEFESVKIEYDRLIKERATANNDNSDNNGELNTLALLRIYYDAQRYQQQNQMLQNELQAAQLRSISIAKETGIDSYFKSVLQAKKRELKELEKINNEFNSNLKPNISSKNTQQNSQASRRSSQPIILPSSYFDRSIFNGRGDFDPMDITLNERAKLQQEYHRIQPGPQEETKKRRVSIKKKLAKIPQFEDEYVKLDEACESLIFSRSQLKNAIESNSAAINALNEAIMMRDETDMSKMIARRRLEQLHIEFPFDTKIERKSKVKFTSEQEKKRLELEEERRRKQEEEEEEEAKEEEEEEEEEEEQNDEYNNTDEEKQEKKIKSKPKQKTNTDSNSNAKANSSFKIKFNFSAFGGKTKTDKIETSASNLASISENSGSLNKENEEINKELSNEEEEKEEEKEEEEEEEENIEGVEFIPSLVRLREVNTERVEKEEKLRAIEEMFTSLFGDRIPPQVTMSLNDKIDLVIKQFNKTK